MQLGRDQSQREVEAPGGSCFSVRRQVPRDIKIHCSASNGATFIVKRSMSGEIVGICDHPPPARVRFRNGGFSGHLAADVL